MSDHSTMEKIGVVDIGSNSVKLLVLDGDTVLHRDSIVTRLGTGVADTGVLGEESIATTINRLNEIRGILDTHGVTNAHAVATAAVRSANNSAPFVESARRALGFDVSVIDGITEGSLAFIGTEFMPRLDEGSILIETRKLPSISLTESVAISRRIEEIVSP